MTSTGEYYYEKVESKKKVYKNSPDYYRIVAPNGNHAGVCMSEERAQWLTDRFNGRKPKGTRGTT